MCMFSLPIPYVAGTSIFARSLADGGQVLVYSMSVEVSEDVAMVLPLPVSEPGIDEAIAFIDLSGYAGFFGDLNKAFPALMLETRSRGGGLAFAGHVQTLQVHDVGDFEASYVPSRKDFARLDRRFRLPDDVWSSLPQYDDFGFAVFKLKKPKRPWYKPWQKHWPQTIHPMALRFTRRNPETLFYPTVHVHDGDVPEQARFDHTLYAQWHDGYDEAFAARSSDEVTFAADVWTRSTDNLGKFVSARKAPEITDPSRRAYQLHLSGMLDNVDTVVHTHGYKPAAL